MAQEMKPGDVFGGEAPHLVLDDEHLLRFYGWHPDRELNPQHAHFPDVERCGALITHRRERGEGPPFCYFGITFDGPVTRELFPAGARWQVESWEPLTLSPSLLCLTCGAHGYVRKGRWEPA